MKLTTKKFKIIKTKRYIKSNDLIFFANGISQKSNEWVKIEQNFKKSSFKYYKLSNKIAKKTFKDSIYLNLKNLVNSITFLLKPLKTRKNFIVKTVAENFESLLFNLLSLKLNSKIYTIRQIKVLFTFEYKRSVLALQRFLNTNLLFYYNKSR